MVNGSRITRNTRRKKIAALVRPFITLPVDLQSYNNVTIPDSGFMKKMIRIFSCKKNLNDHPASIPLIPSGSDRPVVAGKVPGSIPGPFGSVQG